MSIDAAKLALLLTAISNFSTTLKGRLDGKLDINAQAVDSALLEGKTLAEIQSLIGDDINAAIALLQQELAAFVARRDNPHAVTAEQVGLGNVPNFAAATDVEAIAGTATDKLMTAANLGAFWADKVGTAPEALDTIQELATALQNNPDVLTALQAVVGENAAAIEALELSTTAALAELETNKVDKNSNADEVGLTVSRQLVGGEAPEEVSITAALADVAAVAAAEAADLAASKLDKAAKAVTADVVAGTEDEKYVTPLALQPVLAGIDASILDNKDAIDELVSQLTDAFDAAASDIAPAEEV